jgi:hypothetical protein
VLVIQTSNINMCDEKRRGGGEGQSGGFSILYSAFTMKYKTSLACSSSEFLNS